MTIEDFKGWWAVPTLQMYYLMEIDDLTIVDRTLQGKDEGKEQLAA